MMSYDQHKKFAASDFTSIIHRKEEFLDIAINIAKRYESNDLKIQLLINAACQNNGLKESEVNFQNIYECSASIAKWFCANQSFDAAIAWGRCAYIASRYMGTAWISYLDILLKSNVLQKIGLTHRDDQIGSDYDGLVRRKIMQYWDKPTPPPDVRKAINTWILENRDFGHRLVDDCYARNFLRRHFNAQVLKAYDDSPHVSSKCDIFRLAWIYQRGGIYVDADEECLQSVALLIPKRATLVLTYSEGDPPCINNWFLAASTRHSFIYRCLALAVYTVDWSKKESVNLPAWTLTGPGIITMVLLDDFAENGKFVISSDLNIMSEPDFRGIVRWKTDLEYRNSPGGNWRL